MVFSIKNALKKLVPNCGYVGDLRSNDIATYENITWTDIRKKPTFEEVYNEAMTEYKRNICDAVNEKTNYLIMYTCVDPKSGEYIDATMEWQFNVQTLYGIKSTLNYPYLLKIGANKDGSPKYTTLDSEKEFDLIFNVFFNHVNDCLSSGWKEKNNISKMNKEELDSYIDKR